MKNKYESPLSSRYASSYMLELFSSDTRYQTWRKLWVSLAKADRNWEDLPKEAQDYVTYIEKAIECPITYVSVGPERDSIIIRK